MMWHDCGDTDDTNMRISRLSPGAAYVFRVVAHNAQGSSVPEELTQAVQAKPAFGEWLRMFFFWLSRCLLLSDLLFLSLSLFSFSCSC